MIEADDIIIYTNHGTLEGKFIREYKHGIIIKSTCAMQMIPWHYIQFVEYDVVNKKMKKAINEIIGGG